MKRIYLLIFTFLIISTGNIIANSVLDTVPEKNIFKDTIEITTKEVFSINLISNPSTGYRWRMVSPKKQKSVRYQKDEFISRSDELIGAGGKQVFTFLSRKKGLAIIEFEYAIANQEPVKKHITTVIIKKK